MMPNNMHSLLLVIVVALVTMKIRFLPFVLFPAGKKFPKVLDYLVLVLPGAIMGMLVVYCFRSTVVLSWPYAIPEIITTILIVGSYLWKRNTLLSIGAGTVIYMILVQFVFA